MRRWYYTLYLRLWAFFHGYQLEPGDLDMPWLTRKKGQGQHELEERH